MPNENQYTLLVTFFQCINPVGRKWAGVQLVNIFYFRGVMCKFAFWGVENAKTTIFRVESAIQEHTSCFYGV